VFGQVKLDTLPIPLLDVGARGWFATDLCRRWRVATGATSVDYLSANGQARATVEAREPRAPLICSRILDDRNCDEWLSILVEYDCYPGSKAKKGGLDGETNNEATSYFRGGPFSASGPVRVCKGYTYAD
jgi:hypothetical protein